MSTFSKRAAPALSLNIAARTNSLNIESVSSNKENYPEVSTPHLPKKTRFNSNSKTGLSLRKSHMSAYQSQQENENPDDTYPEKASPLTPLELPEWTPTEPKSGMLRKKRAETSYCGDESPILTEITNLPSLPPIERDFGDDLYQRAEEYLDSLHLVIVLPEDHRRRPFGHLRVSTAKVALSDSAPSEYNSPSLISPCISTSSLIQRRSSSKKMDSDSSPARPKLSLAKSPFYTCTGKGRRLFGIDTAVSKGTPTEIEEDNTSTQDKLQQGLTVVTSLNVKFTGMSLRGSREPSEPSSATSFKIEEDSPLKIII